MQFRVAVLLAAMPFGAMAQHAGGMPGSGGGGRGGWGSPTPGPPRFPGFGHHPLGGGRSGFGAPMSFGSSPSWFNTPLCASPLFPLAPNCGSFGDPGGGMGYYPPPPIYVNPTVNVTAPAPVPSAVADTSGADASVLYGAPQTGPATAAPADSGRLIQADSAAYPPRISSADDKCPPLIVLKTGGMYSIKRYWIRGQTLYFETTASDTLYAPLALLERIIPGR